MKDSMISQSNTNDRKEWECNNKENIIRTKLLLFINKETQKGLLSQNVRMNSKTPKDILAEYEQYEIVINTPLIIGNKRNVVVVSDHYQRNSNKKRRSTVEYYFPTKTRLNNKKKIGSFQPTLLAQSPSTSSTQSYRGGSILQLKSTGHQSEGKMNWNMLILRQIASTLITKPLPKVRLLRKATKHETMGINETKVMKRLEQITFREETSFYNDSNEMHAVDLDVYNGISRAANDLSMASYQRHLKRSKTDQTSNGNCEFLLHQMRY